MPEEEAFAVLVKLMQDYNMRELFKPSMAELGLCMYQLEHLIMVSLYSVFLTYLYKTAEGLKWKKKIAEPGLYMEPVT